MKSATNIKKERTTLITKREVNERIALDIKWAFCDKKKRGGRGYDGGELNT